MSQVTIRNRRRDENAIPAVCACCGQPTKYAKTKHFSWHPPWVYAMLLANVLVYLIVAGLVSKGRTLDMPLCERHRRHWFWRTLFTVGGLILCIVLFIALPITGGVITNNDTGLCLGLLAAGVAFLAWIIVALVLQSQKIKPTVISDDEITLTNVCPDFARAFGHAIESDRRKRMARAIEEEEEEGRRPTRWREDDRPGRSNRPDKGRRRPRAEEEEEYRPDERYRGR